MDTLPYDADLIAGAFVENERPAPEELPNEVLEGEAEPEPLSCPTTEVEETPVKEPVVQAEPPSAPAVVHARGNDECKDTSQTDQVPEHVAPQEGDGLDILLHVPSDSAVPFSVLDFSVPCLHLLFCKL